MSTLTHIHIDLGNSRGKWRLLHDGVVLQQGTVDPETGLGLPNLAALDPAPLNPIQVVLASVADASLEAHLRSNLRDRFDCAIETLYTPASALGMTNSYTDPARLGVDRWLAMLAAWHPKQEDVVVVDAGSALTVDVVSASGQHQGGLILPGVHLSERALLERTGKVRFDDDVAHELLLGKSTAECVRFGIAHAQLGALESVAQRFSLQGHRWCFAGGAGQWLCQRMAIGGELAPDLVLEGIALMASE